MTRQEFSEAVQTYCVLTGGSVSSWGRTVWHNHVVRGVEHSAHQYWLGADARQWEHYTPEERQEAVKVVGENPGEPINTPPGRRAEVARRLGLRVIFEGDHDHLQPLDWRAG